MLKPNSQARKAFLLLSLVVISLVFIASNISQWSFSSYALASTTTLASKGFEPATQARIPLRLYFNEARSDNATMAGESEGWATGAGYRLAATLGYLLREPQPGTIPLKLYYSEERHDNVTMAGDSERLATEAGYRLAATLGYIFKEPQSGTIPLKLYYSEERTDNASMAGESEGWAIGSGYSLVATLGYIYPEIPLDAVRAGQESDGRPIYVCIAVVLAGSYGDSRTGGTEEVPGKFTNGQCYYGNRWSEQVATNYRILRTTEVVVWGAARIISRENPYRDGNSEYTWDLEAAFRAGLARYITSLTGQRYALALYSCRGNIGGGIHSGVVTNRGNTCSIPYGGRIEAVNNFEVLYIVPRATFTGTPRATSVTLSAVTSNIHNGDCKRFYGTVNLSVWITNSPGGRKTAPINGVSGGGTIINWERGPVRNINNFSGAGVTAPNVENINSTYNIDQALLNQNRVILVISSNLGSAHKGCDLCTDFTWEAKMPAVREQAFSLRDVLNQTGVVKTVVVGPYRASDNRHDFRVHFEVR